MSKSSGTGINWGSGIAINLVSNLIGIAVGAVVTYFTHNGSGWIIPLLCGGAAWLMTFGGILGWRIMSRYPSVERVTSENVQEILRRWLDKFSLTVQTLHDPASDFLFIVTTDGGKKVSIRRSKEPPLNDYLLVQAQYNASQEERNTLEQTLNTEQKASLRLAVQLELARGVMGYTSPSIHEFTIFKRVAISSNLTESEILNAVWDVEAMLTAIFSVGALMLQRARLERQGQDRRDVGSDATPFSESESVRKNGPEMPSA